MRTTILPAVLLALCLPAVATAHPCEAEVAGMQEDLEAIRQAVAALETGTPSDLRTQMLAGARGKYELEAARTAEARARCERLVREENPGATASPAGGGAAIAAPQAASPVPTDAAALPAAQAPAAPAPAVLPAPAAVPATPAVPAAAASATEIQMPAVVPCFPGCGKDTDCKGDRICVKGECVDPPARKSPSP